MMQLTLPTRRSCLRMDTAFMTRQISLRALTSWAIMKLLFRRACKSSGAACRGPVQHWIAHGTSAKEVEQKMLRPKPQLPSADATRRRRRMGRRSAAARRGCLASRHSAWMFSGAGSRRGQDMMFRGRLQRSRCPSWKRRFGRQGDGLLTAAFTAQLAGQLGRQLACKSSASVVNRNAGMDGVCPWAHSMPVSRTPACTMSAPLPRQRLRQCRMPTHQTQEQLTLQSPGAFRSPLNRFLWIWIGASTFRACGWRTSRRNASSWRSVRAQPQTS
mmetsp:Transcript_13511/g.32223  ORF Transcript_13511/g.32223 Transcript_13511/m.32223 type:complete len:273 (+) Transcript_13511:2062-2880(+)